MSTEIINWKNIFKQSSIFKNHESTKWAFVEEFIDRDFYDQLYDTYPKLDETWTKRDSFDKNGFHQSWANQQANEVASYSYDKKFSESWNHFYKYLFSDNFIENMRKFSGIPVTKLKHFTFTLLPKRGFQLPHIHNVGPNTIVIMMYFSKDWEKGDPGGTYVSTEEDESSIVFEPYNLDNSAMIFHDGPSAGHGVRQIKKNVERRAIQIYLEEYSEADGWSGDKKDEQKLVEL